MAPPPGEGLPQHPAADREQRDHEDRRALDDPRLERDDHAHADQRAGEVRVVADAVGALSRLTHRGAVGADPKAGDGAGILCGLFFAVAIIRYGVRKFREEQLNHPDSDIRIGRWWDVVIGVLSLRDLLRGGFVFGAAQAIALPDCAVDAVIMLKSLHHVPIADMDEALDEIARVLRPGGLAYLSEPVYAGEFNEILRLFNDERWVREAAFAAVCRAVERAVLTLQEEIHFLSVSRFAGFADFQQRVLGATHSTFSIDDALFDRVRQRFQAHVGSDGHAEFLNPMRVDLLRKPG